MFRCGTKRFVLLIGGLAAKFPRVRNWSAGLRANRREIELSKQNWPALCPIYCHFGRGLCLVMPRTRPVTKTELDEKFPTEQDWCEFMDTGNYCSDPEFTPFFLPGEFKPCSYGWLGGQMVLIDYEDED